MKELLLALSILFSFWFGFTAIGKLIRNQEITGFHILILSLSVTALITHFLGMW